MDTSVFTIERFRHLAGRALDLVLPPRCLACGSEMARNGEICADCWSGLRFVPAPMCRRCGTPIAREAMDDRSCHLCFGREPHYDHLRSAIIYDHVSRGMILAMKHRERLEGIGLFSHWMVDAARDIVHDTDAVVPVPVHRFKLIRRGFNQAGELAKAIGRQIARPVHLNTLRKVEATATQVGLDGDQRLRNVNERHFRVPASMIGRIAGKNLLLIDDVYTTGATTAACAAVLRSAGAERVDVLTLARVVNEHSRTI